MDTIAREVQAGQSFIYNGIEYQDVDVCVDGRGRLHFVDNWDVPLTLEPTDPVRIF